jgi:glutamine synthetase
MTQKQIIAEYVWHDALGALRSKGKNFVKTFDRDVTLDDFSEWNFDGSSTGQAEGRSSDVVLRPVALFKDPFRRNWPNAEAYLVLCDTYNMDGTPHGTNNRAKCMEVCERTKEFEPWFGIEQEYVIFQLGKSLTCPELPYGWMDKDLPNYRFPEQAHPHVASSVICNDGYYPLPSSAFYCGVGADRIFGRKIVEQHYECCLYAGVKACGINWEVSPAQAEIQIGICSAHEMGDHLWMARYLLSRVAEEHGAYVELHPKPYGPKFNGSGSHTNFSTKEMRDENGYSKIVEACEKMSKLHAEHLAEYGDESNKLRLTGKHETASYEKFSYGASDRGTSIRIPYTTHKAGKGYLEDRRPASNCDPYKVVTRMLKTICLDEK